MKKTFLFMFVAIAAMSALLLPLTGVTAAQEPRGTGASASTFVMSEFTDKPVKGAPYSAQAVTETRQRLADGNEIVNKSEAIVYRDSQGRTRREQNLKTIGGLAEAPPVQIITISDPVAGATYTLDSATKTARAFKSFLMGGSGTAVGPVSINGAGAGAVTVSRFEGGATQGGTGFTVSTSSGGQVSSGGAERVTLTRQALENVKREDLGTQNIEGVEATGTRTTVTIAAGEIGNEKPIEVISERWVSKDLQTTVLTRRVDPRSGETTFRLTNINRSEPASSLFEVPGDYKITDAGGGFIRTRQ